jgi:hypothetical protein
LADRRTHLLADRRGGGRGAPDPRGGLGADALLLLGGALGSAPRPLAQPLELARLREHQQRQNGDPDEGGKCRDRSDLGERFRQRQRQERS